MFLCSVGTDIQATEGYGIVEAILPFTVEAASTVSIFITYSSYGDIETWKYVGKMWEFIPYHNRGSEQIHIPRPMHPNYTVNAVASIDPGTYTIRAWVLGEGLPGHQPTVSITAAVGDYTGANNVYLIGVA